MTKTKREWKWYQEKWSWRGCESVHRSMLTKLDIYLSGVIMACFCTQNTTPPSPPHTTKLCGGDINLTSVLKTWSNPPYIQMYTFCLHFSAWLLHCCFLFYLLVKLHVKLLCKNKDRVYKNVHLSEHCELNFATKSSRLQVQVNRKLSP